VAISHPAKIARAKHGQPSAADRLHSNLMERPGHVGGEDAGPGHHQGKHITANQIGD
jgi:hypothetical protein